MKLSKILTEEQIILNLQADNHWSAIEELVDNLVKSGHLAADLHEKALTALREREEMISTGIGTGVAIPHAFLDELTHVTAVFGRSVNGIDFEALDNFPVHFIVLFLVPSTNYPLHLQTLAAIAKLFINKEIRSHLAAATTTKEIVEAFTKKNSRPTPKSSAKPTAKP